MIGTVRGEPREPARPPRVMLSCGEASGDLYAAALTNELRRRRPDIDVFGFGGERLAAAGADLVGDYRGFTVTGLTEALRVLPRSWRMLRSLKEAAARRRPDVFVAIDFPDFNFRLLPEMQRLGIPVVYYVSPQLWAWRPGRLATLKRYVSRMLVIFPFEEELYRNAGVPVDFVGHPLVDLVVPTEPRDQFLRAQGLDAASPVVALLPGSRPNELRLILPTLVDAARLIAARRPGVQFLVARAPALDDALFEPLAGLGSSLPRRVITGETDNVLAAADIVITASGTATVQTALHGRPMVIVYRLSPLTYAIGKRFVNVGSYGMVNLIAGRKVVPELIQHDFTADRTAREVVALLTDAGTRTRMGQDLEAVRAKLGAGGASARAADAVLAYTDSRDS